MSFPPESGDNGVSPLSSLRTDLAGRPTTPHDDVAIVVASLLRRAAQLPHDAVGARAHALASRFARRSLPPEVLRHGPVFDEPGRRSPNKVLRTFADETMRVHGSLALASNMLESLATLVAPDSYEGGLLLSQRAAIAFYAGETDMSNERYRQVIRLGKRLGERELVARGMLGLAGVRMVAGNYPEGERASKRAIRYCGNMFPRLRGNATLRLAVVYATRGLFDRALDHAWRAYKLVRRIELDRQLVLVNLAQILYDAGHPEAARAAASHLLRQKLQRQQLLGVLGTYACASAATHDGGAVEWASRQLWRLAKAPWFTQTLADALLDCSFALEEIGHVARAARLRARARETAVRHGYHDIAYLAEHSIRRGRPRTPSRLKHATAAIVSEVCALRQDRGPLLEVHAG